ncbi:MAG: zf-TFIIB domain-containing protein [Polyangiaceae bacterium]
MTNEFDPNAAMGNDAGTARCPQCKEVLETANATTVVGYPCHHCGGIWLETATMQKVVSYLDPQSIQMSEQAAEGAEEPFPAHQASPPCPMCGTSMTTFVLPGTDVEVDRCGPHGTWLDRGELETIVRELTKGMYEALDKRATAPPNVRARVKEMYGLDPGARATKLPFLLEEALELYDAIVHGDVGAVPNRECGDDGDDDNR